MVSSEPSWIRMTSNMVGLPAYWFIDSKKSSLDLESFILSSRNSIASMVPICIRMRRSTHIFDNLLLSTSSSSLRVPDLPTRSEEHTSELQSLMRISYAVFCLKKKMLQGTNILQEVVEDHYRTRMNHRP